MFNVLGASSHLPLEIRETIQMLDNFYYSYENIASDYSTIRHSSKHIQQQIQFDKVSLTYSHISVNPMQFCVELSIITPDSCPQMIVEWSNTKAIGTLKRSPNETAPHTEYSPLLTHKLIYPGWLTLRLYMFKHLDFAMKYI